MARVGGQLELFKAGSRSVPLVRSGTGGKPEMDSGMFLRRVDSVQLVRSGTEPQWARVGGRLLLCEG
jgi:hypothetical protein